MNRRTILAQLGASSVVWPSAVRAQQKTMPVIGYLDTLARGPDAAAYVAAIRQGLSENGYVEGQNVAGEYRSAEGQYNRLEPLAAELVSRKVDVIVTSGVPAARAAKSATSSIPIVFLGGGDPVANGLVASLARPGGNLTGIVDLVVELFPKRLEILRELVPEVEVFGLLMNPNNPSTERVIRDMQETARANRVYLHVAKASDQAEINAAFVSLLQQKTGGLVVAGDPFFIAQRQQIVALAARNAIPAIYAQPQFAKVGGLISYTSDTIALARQAGIYIGKILKGTKPADLPVQQPTKFELVINLKTAKALGLTIPPSILARADEVIE